MMHMHTCIYSYICQCLIFVMLFFSLGCESAQPDTVKKDVQKMIQHAEELSQKGQYAEALRVLFDAMYKEERARSRFIMESEEALSFDYPIEKKFPIIASERITTLEKSLLYKDQSLFAQILRDPDFPLEEKLAYVRELRTVVVQGKHQNKEHIVLRGQAYDGALIQVLTSHMLRQEEKMDVLFWIESTIQTEYTSSTQKQQIKEEIVQLQRRAEQKFQEQHYVEAFLLLGEAEQKAHEINYSGVDSMVLAKQFVHMRDALLQTDESPLMQAFKAPKVSFDKKHQMWSALWTHASTGTGTFFFEGVAYNGPLVQILTHPKIEGITKMSILQTIESMMKQEYALP